MHDSTIDETHKKSREIKLSLATKIKFWCAQKAKECHISLTQTLRDFEFYKCTTRSSTKSHIKPHDTSYRPQSNQQKYVLDRRKNLIKQLQHLATERSPSTHSQMLGNRGKYELYSHCDHTLMHKIVISPVSLSYEPSCSSLESY